MSCNSEEAAWKEGNAKSIPPVYLGAGLGLFVLGAILASAFDSYLPSSLSNSKKSYSLGETAGRSTGFAEAKAKVENSSLGKAVKAFTNPQSLAGKVLMANDESVTIKVHTNDPFADPSLLERTITLNSSTTVNLISQKVPAIKIQPKRGEAVTSTSEPLPEITKVRGSDILEGDSIRVFLIKETIAEKMPTAISVQILPRTLVLIQ